MRLATLRRPRHEPPLPGLHGTARVQRRADAAARRARPGDVVVLEHLDLDGTSARLLVDARVGAVVNAAPSISGRYPNLGPQVLVAAGIPVLDRVGAEVMARLDDGEKVRLDGDTLYRGEEIVCRGQLLTGASVADAMEAARAGLGSQLAAFAHATTEHLRRERDLLLDGSGAPAVRTPLEQRLVVVVASARGADRELADLRPWLRDRRAVLVGVDEGADALLAASLRPHIVVGDPRRMSEDVLDCGAEMVVRADLDGSAPGLHRAEQAGLEPVVFTTGGSDEDAALLLVEAHEPALVVGVGWHPTLAALVDSQRPDMPSAFLTRLRLGDRYVDASAVITLHRRPARTWPLWLLCVLLLGALAAVVVVAPASTPVGDWRQQVVDRVDEVINR
ncbi:MAG TPA: putative cytokinetic ring protein SteA [Actinomycetes bacterium]|jgi:uncharacterized membrane-anchored protein